MKEVARRLMLGRPRAYRLTRMGLQVARYLVRRPHEPDFSAFAGFPGRGGEFVDVGANAGMSAMSFRIFQRTSPIVSIEPNRELEPELRIVGRLVPSFRYVICALGDRDGELTLHVPFYRGVAITAAASLDRAVVEDHTALREMLGERVASADFEVREQTVPLRRLDGLDLSPDFLKVDVEGVELTVLRGALGTIERCRPVILLERSRDFPAICELLGARGYGAFAYVPARDALEPIGGRQARNAFFLPGPG